ncbi:MAG: TolC family protein [Alphaproteobacteria bacterium]|nr:TolC family protein [Alphaproteobacteria bacterium]
MERATRAQLRAEYQVRLDQTEADAWRIWHGLVLLRTQVQQLARSVPELRKMAETGRKAYAAGNLAPATYVLLETSLSAREGELFDLRATLWQDAIALRTLLAMTPLIPEQTHAH